MRRIADRLLRFFYTAFALVLLTEGSTAAAPVLGLTYTVDETSPEEGIVVMTGADFFNGIVPANFVPRLGFVIFCEGAITSDEMGCGPNATASDIFEWYRNDITVRGQSVERYLLREFSDASDSGEPTEVHTVGSQRSCADLKSTECFALIEPGLVSVPGTPLFRESGPEIFEYTPADRELANKTAPGFVRADRNRSYLLESDTPEPSTFGMLALAGFLAGAVSPLLKTFTGETLAWSEFRRRT